MADQGLTLNVGADGADLAVDVDGLSRNWQYCKLAFGASGTQTRVETSAPLPVHIGDGSAQASIGGGVEAGALRVTLASDGSGLISVDDNGGSLTVDWAGTPPPIGAGTEAAALRVTLANDSTGVVNMRNDDVVSANNSTTTPLGSDGVFLATADNVLGFSSLSIVIVADEDSAANGMVFEASTDNVNWDAAVSFTMIADDTRAFEFPVLAQYFRINYTNGATAQGVFRVQTILHRQDTGTSTHRISDDVGVDRSGKLVKAAIIAQTPAGGDFITLQATTGGNFKVSIEEVNGTVSGGGAEASAMRVTLANDSTGLLSIDDNGGSLTIDAANDGSFVAQLGDGTSLATIRNLSANDALNVAIVDGAGDHITSLGVTGSGVEAAALRVTMATDSTGLLAVSDGGGNLSVDWAGVVPPIGGGTEAAALRVTMANNSSGLLSVDSARTTAAVAATDDTSSMMDGATEITVERAELTTAATGDQELIAAQASVTHRILALMILATASTNAIYINDGTVNLIANATNKIALDVTGATGPQGLIMQYNSKGWFQTGAANRPININLGSANAITAVATYVDV